MVIVSYLIGSDLHHNLIIWFSNKFYYYNRLVLVSQNTHNVHFCVFNDLSFFRLQWRVKIHFWLSTQCVTPIKAYKQINGSFITTNNSKYSSIVVLCIYCFNCLNCFYKILDVFFLFFFLLFFVYEIYSKRSSYRSNRNSKQQPRLINNRLKSKSNLKWSSKEKSNFDTNNETNQVPTLKTKWKSKWNTKWKFQALISARCK